MRKASMGVGLVLLLMVVAQPPAPAYAQDEEEITTLSLLGLGGLILFDIATAPLSADRYNKKQAQRSPTMNLRDGSLGLAFRFSFNRARLLHAGYVNRYTPPVPSFARQQKRKSPALAFMLSLGATFAPILLGAESGVFEDLGVTYLIFSGALVLGPSVGHWYAEQYSRGLLTAGLRVLMVALFLNHFHYT